MAEARHGAECIDGVTWQWHEMGDGPLALVVMPGAIGSTDLFFVLFQELCRDLRVIGLDLPFVTDAGLALRHLDHVLARRGVVQAILLGASFSGVVVQVYARQYPARTRALILSHTGALDPSRAPRQRATARRAARVPLVMLRGLLRLVVRLLLRRVNERRFWMEHHYAVVDGLTRDAVVSRYLLAASLEELGGQPWAGDLLVIHSDNDTIANADQQRRLREQYPQAQWIEFKNAGHSSYSRDPMAYAEAVLAFVRRVRLPHAAAVVS
jgi:pimeloyl-ACP methyl ester carboxylesterase